MHRGDAEGDEGAVAIACERENAVGDEGVVSIRYRCIGEMLKVMKVQ